MRVLVTGGLGTLGRALAATEAFGPSAEVTYVGRALCDVTDVLALQRVFRAVSPDVVVHAAAITDHQCRDAAALIATNVIGTAHVARMTRAWGASLCYLSTHYVYGDRGDWREWDPCTPIGAYAMSKRAGELAAEVCDRLLVVRGSWYDFDTRLRHWVARGALTDAWVSREPVEEAARKIGALVRSGARGVFNIGGLRRTFAAICADEGVAAPPLTRAELDAVGAAPYPFPRDVSVNTEKFAAWIRERGQATRETEARP